jgi:hypothetical protein
MAKQHNGHLVGPIKGRTEYHNEGNGTFMVRDTDNGQFIRGGSSHHKNMTREK